MGDQLSIVNQGGTVTLVGEIYDVGATEGDVLTIQSDGSVAAEAGGGSQPLTGDGSPNGSVAATFIGQQYIDTTNGAQYIAEAVSDSTWALVGGAGQGATDVGVFTLVAGPQATLQDGTGSSLAVSGGSIDGYVAATGDAFSLTTFAGKALYATDDGAGHTQLGFFDYLNAVVQPPAPTLVATTTPALASYGFTQAQAEALIAAVNALITALSASNGGNGLMG